MKNLFSFLICLLAVNIYADNYQVVKNGPVHEAYIVQEYGNLLLQAVPQRPPEKITELTPEKTDPEAIWLPGYWEWSPKYKGFLWVSGLWRRPPPGGKKWIAGDWRQTSAGWVRLKGFWSAQSLDGQKYIPNPPPDLIDEKVVPPPKPENTYFWISGYWTFDEQKQQFLWNPGKWAPIQAHWVYCPPRYLWREEGYLFNPAYWDWPIEERGLVYASISIEPQAIKTITYEPQNGLHELYVLEQLFPEWPNYYNFFHYHYFFHHDLWIGWGAVPNWWEWPTWWCFTWQDLWGLWWWWTHPGYPNPVWLDKKYAEMIAPPAQFMIEMMASIPAPPYVTPNGVVGLDRLLKGINGVTGKENPILPYNPNQRARIENRIKPAAPSGLYLKPAGTRPVKSAPLKPYISSGQEGQIPIAPQKKPVPSGRRAPLSYPQQGMRPSMPTAPPTSPYQPIPQGPVDQYTQPAPVPGYQPPSTQPPPGLPHQGHRINQFPQRAPAVHQPYPSAVPPAPIPQQHYGVKGYPQQSRQAPDPYQSSTGSFYPQQGYQIDRTPKQPMQAQHLNRFMNQHQPQQDSSETVVPNLYDGRYHNLP